MSTILLPVPPHGFNAVNPAGLAYENNVGKIQFDDAVNESVYYEFRMPSDYGTDLTAKLVYSMESAAAGNISMQVSIWATAPGESAILESYDTANVGSETVPGAAGLTSDLSIALIETDGVAAGELVRIRVLRDAATDTAAGDLNLWAISLEYEAV